MPTWMPASQEAEPVICLIQDQYSSIVCGLEKFTSIVSYGHDNIVFIVLDEADRILDMGFSETVNAIIENLPEERQTLLYSATQTR